LGIRKAITRDITYSLDDDHLYFEDETGRVELHASQLNLPRVSGLCVAIFGRMTQEGKFVVTDFRLPGWAPQIKPSISPLNVAIVSDIYLGTIRAQLYFETLIEFLTVDECNTLIPRPPVVILLGNIFASDDSGKVFSIYQPYELFCRNA